LFGDNGDDTLNGNLGEDLVFGGTGDDLVRGGKGTDLVSGEEGNDTLIGDFGLDVLVGGTGRDLFVLRPDTVITDPNGVDIIIDFNPLSDRIGVTGGYSEANLILSQQTISLNTILSIPEIANIPELRPERIAQTLLGLTGINIDPNNDGLVTGTLIQLPNGASLGFFVNSAPGDLRGTINPIPEIN